MSFDIRRCSKEDLDRLQAEAKAWRERHETIEDKPPAKPLVSDQLELVLSCAAAGAQNAGT